MSKRILTITLFALGLLTPLSYASAGTIVGVHKFAWSDNVGYINFEHVIVNDATLKGYAWSSNKGFINFEPAAGGVINDGAGNLSGSAWGEQLGWISFSGVHINTSNGLFSGTASGVLVGSINFDCPSFCDVETDWRPGSSPPPATTTPSSGGGGGGTSRTIQQTPKLPPAPIAPAALLRTTNIGDINSMMADWGTTLCGSAGDLDQDCTVGIFDFNLAMVNWGA